MSRPILIRSRDELRAVRDRAWQANASSAPLYEAAAEGVIALAIAHHPDGSLSREITDGTNRPLLVLVCDDPPFNAADAIGPAGWVLSRRLQYWRPLGCLIHAAGAEGAEYRVAVAATIVLGRFLLIETGSAQARAWCDVVEPLCATTVIFPSDGAHPVPETRH